MTTYLLRQNFNVKGAFAGPGIVPIPDISIPYIDHLPFIGPVLSGQNLLLFITIGVVIFIDFLVFKTPYGMRLRAAGYNAGCLDSSGINTNTIRVWSLIICGVLCGLAGAYISLADVNSSQKMSAGRASSRWRDHPRHGNPIGITLISLLFGLLDSFGILLQFLNIPPQFASMLPYFATLVALYVYSLRLKRQT